MKNMLLSPQRIAVLLSVLLVAACSSTQPTKSIEAVKEGKISLTQGTGGGPSIQRALKLVITSWDFHRTQYPIHWDSTFNGTARLIDAGNGEVMSWNTIETWAQDDCGANPSDTRWYKTVSNTTDAPFGFGTKDGKSNHASAYLKFYGNAGVWTASIQSSGC